MDKKVMLALTAGAAMMSQVAIADINAGVNAAMNAEADAKAVEQQVRDQRDQAKADLSTCDPVKGHHAQVID